MRINYVAKNYKISNKFKEIIEKKLEKLSKYFRKDYEVKVNCIEQGDVQKLEITINADGMFLRSEVVSDNMYNNIDLAMPKIEKQIIKNSSRDKSKFLRTVNDPFEFLTEVPAAVSPKLVRKKRFELEPLTIEDAETNMLALGHNFYIFLNVETGKVSVLYSRADNDLGLIEVDY